MKLNTIRNTVIVVGAIALIGVGIYALLLDDEAKGELKRARQSIGKSYDQINGVMSAISGIVDEHIDVDELPNRQATIAQWEALGY